MKIDKKKTYIIELLLLIVLTLCAFYASANTKIFLSLFILISAILVSFMLRKEPNSYTNIKKVKNIMIIFGVLYLALFYVLGMYTGFTKSNYIFSIKTFFEHILPLTIIIIGTELIRKKLLIVKTNISKMLVLIITSLIDILMYLYIYDITKYNDFLSIIGFLTFSSIASNILYIYMSPRYGEKPIIAYKLITILYIYIIPVVPDVYVYFRTFFRIIFPLFIYIHLDNYYNPDKELEKTKDKRKGNFVLAFTFVLMTLLICLISCKFTYGALVIGSNSMANKIVKGDVIIFKNEKDNLEVGDVIVFKRDTIRIVHRIVRITTFDDGYHYYTKGDANQSLDEGYVVKDEILGKVQFKIKSIGKPTLWLREQFE